MKIKLQYTTDAGFEWLEEVVEVNESNYMKVVNDYVERNQHKADSLEAKWQKNGEDVRLFLDIEPIDTNLSKELFKRVYTHVDNL